jgi:hypothetical protein
MRAPQAGNVDRVKFYAKLYKSMYNQIGILYEDCLTLSTDFLNATCFALYAKTTNTYPFAPQTRATFLPIPTSYQAMPADGI